MVGYKMVDTKEDVRTRNGILERGCQNRKEDEMVNRMLEHEMVNRKEDDGT